MSINVTTNTRTINVHSDFRVAMQFANSDGDLFLPQGDFSARFYTAGRSKCTTRNHVCGCENGRLYNCEFTEDTEMVVRFDNPDFGLGQLFMDLVLSEEDALMADGEYNTNIPIGLPIKVIQGAGDDADVALVRCLIQYEGDTPVVDLTGYYTKAEVNTLLGDYAAAEHTHEIADIDELTETLAGKANKNGSYGETFKTRTLFLYNTTSYGSATDDGVALLSRVDYATERVTLRITDTYNGVGNLLYTFSGDNTTNYIADQSWVDEHYAAINGNVGEGFTAHFLTLSNATQPSLTFKTRNVNGLTRIVFDDLLHVSDDDTTGTLIYTFDGTATEHVIATQDWVEANFAQGSGYDIIYNNGNLIFSTDGNTPTYDNGNLIL